MTHHRGLMKRVVLVLGALVAAVWYFILRVGPRRELPEGATPVTAEGAIDHARRVAAVDQVVHADLVGTWAPTTATDVEVLVEGNTFYPRMLEDIATATGSIHVMQYGFQPGVVGDPFARGVCRRRRATASRCGSSSTRSAATPSRTRSGCSRTWPPRASRSCSTT